MAYFLSILMLALPLQGVVANPVAVSLNERACSTVSNVYHTFFGYPDNDPPGPAIAYSCGRSKAGGDGSFGNPLTFASAPGEFTKCEVIYIPYLKKYARFEDLCGQCVKDFNNGRRHIDIWTGSNTINGGQAQLNCENKLTRDGLTILRQPPSGLPVDNQGLFTGGNCNTVHTYPGNSASCSSTQGLTSSSETVTTAESTDDDPTDDSSSTTDVDTDLDETFF